jgi:uncharacterized protein DUF1877
VAFGAAVLKHIIGIYIRLDAREVARLRDNPGILPKYDPRVALADGRGLDLGRAWEELGVFLDGGVKLPEGGATLGDFPLPTTDPRATWSYIEPARVAVLADELAKLGERQFRKAYEVDGEDTDVIPGSRTDGWGDRAQYLWKKMQALAIHYREAAQRGEAMLVRIGEKI